MQSNNVTTKFMFEVSLYVVEQNAKVSFRYLENLLEIPEGMHGELAFWVGLQIDDMTEQLYSVKKHLSFRRVEQPTTPFVCCIDKMKKMCLV